MQNGAHFDGQIDHTLVHNESNSVRVEQLSELGLESHISALIKHILRNLLHTLCILHGTENKF